MKKTFLPVLLICSLLFSSCLKDNDTCQDRSVQSEAATIQSYASTQGIAATAHSSGIYYQIVTQGTGVTPTATSKVYVTYTGKLLDGTVFDSGSTPAGGWALAGLIPGWQIALPLLQKGGTMKLIVPSSLAYGCRGIGSIPGNAILFFDIQLTDVQ